MRNVWRQRRWVVVGLAIGVSLIAGCTGSKNGSGGGGSSSDLGVLAREDSPRDVAAARSFFVVPNMQVSMRSNFVAGSPLAQVFADRIASGLVGRGLTQAPADFADVTVTFNSQTPVQGSGTAPVNTQSLDYAGQLLSDAKSMQTKDNFLDNGYLDFRVEITSTKTHAVIWRGSIAGVQPAGKGPRDRLLDVLDAVDRLMGKYPKVK